MYLDYSSSAPIDLRVLDYMIEIYKNYFGNADSRTHDYGNQARKIVEKARKSISDLILSDSDEIFFTSGATESNNIVLQGLMEYAILTNKKHIITTAIEHKSILETCKYLESKGFTIDYINPEKSGRINANDIFTAIKEDTLLVSVIHANNETGVIQPVKEIGEFLNEKDVFFHIDATQSFGKLVDEIKNLKYDMLSMSSHKISGPQGVGALVLRKKDYRRPPVKGIFHGGQQEKGIRPGTLPVPLIAGLGKACELSSLEYKKWYDDCYKIKLLLLELLDQSGVSFCINGDLRFAMPNIINICFDQVSSEALMLASKQFCGISNGSACNSNSYSPSYVLSAMGITKEQIENSVRISWGSEINLDEFKISFQQFLNIVKGLQ